MKRRELFLIVAVIILVSIQVGHSANIQTPVWLKKLTVPWTNETKQIDAVQMWEVRWQSDHGHYDFSRDNVPEIEAFTSEEAAENFATSLRQAFALVRDTNTIDVSVRKAK